MKRLCVILFLLMPLMVNGATYYVATNGLDTNPGTEAEPFLTVQKGLTKASPGDTILVGQGWYAENAATKSNATAASRIVLDGQNVARLQSLNVNHSNQVIQNFTFPYSPISWRFQMGQYGDYCIISNNVYDGGMTNLQALFTWQIPVSGPFGKAGSHNLVISNLITRSAGLLNMTMYGDNNTVQGNVFRDSDYHDWIRIYGRSNLITGNVFTNMTVEGTGDHPDWFQVSGEGAYGSKNHIFEKNLVIKMDSPSQIAQISGADNADVYGFVFRNNIFVDVAQQASIAARDVWFYNNTFYRSGAGAVLNWTVYTNIFFTNFIYNSGHGGRCFNNVFADCSQGLSWAYGWYIFHTNCTNIGADYNYVSRSNHTVVDYDEAEIPIGDPGGWQWYNWFETNGINGGNPLFYNPSRQNFRLAPDSPLTGSGYDFSGSFTDDYYGNTRNTWDIGAVEFDNSVGELLDCSIDPKALRAFPLIENDAIWLCWPTNQYRTDLTVRRRPFNAAVSDWLGWSNVLTVSANLTNGASWEDTNISAGTHYEYELYQRVTNWVCGGVTQNWYGSYQYISTGIDVPLVDDRGSIILLVDRGLTNALASELDLLVQDLRGDGYKVLRHNVDSMEITNSGWASSIGTVKALIDTDYAANPSDDWSLFIVGHVPVPYSGLSSPGAHSENYGAHPAEWFYADTTGTNAWTDTTANDTTADFTPNHNTPGDGKYDQTYPASAPEIRVIGRLDLTNQPAFSGTYQELTAQYLTRNHQWRHGQIIPRQIALSIETNTSSNLPYWPHNKFSSFFSGGDVSDLGPWLSIATNTDNSYLFLASKGSGNFDRDTQLGYTTNFAAVSLYGVFTRMFGSYYGDYDSGTYASNAVLHAPLASGGYGLTVIYDEPYMNMDSVSMNQPIGQEAYEMAANQFAYSSNWYWAYNSSSPVRVYSKNYVVTLGDPTLRLWVVAPPTNAVLTTNGADYVITWTDSTDADVEGYHVYRAPTADLNDFTRLTTPPTNSPYTDAGAAGTAYTYMVRAVKLEDSAQRSFYNASQGIFAEAQAGEGGGATNLIRGAIRGNKAVLRGEVILR